MDDDVFATLVVIEGARRHRLACEKPSDLAFIAGRCRDDVCVVEVPSTPDVIERLTRPAAPAHREESAPVHGERDATVAISNGVPAPV